MQHYTTIEQSKKLVELGLNPETADMAIVKENTYCNALSAFNGTTLCQNYSKIKNKTIYIPCWSLGALLELMPEPYQLTSNRDNKYQLMLINNPKSDWFNTSLEAAYNMVCWLLENDYIKKGE